MKQNNSINWQQIYSNYSPKLLGICRRYIPDIQTAEDILQDSFITAIQNNHQLRDEKALFGWLKKIVVNNALQYLRKDQKDLFVSIEPSEIPDNFSEMNHPALEEKNIFIYDFTKEQLLSSIDSLPSHHKSVFNLYFIDNHSHAEISGILGITVNTSKSHLLRAKKSVQNFLMSHVDENTPKNKKKMAQLLVIFGFGGLLWAQTFQSAFSNFKISPSKSFEIPDHIKINTQQSFSINTNAWKKKIIAGSTALIIVAASAFIINPKNNIFNKNEDFSVKNSDSIDVKDLKSSDETIKESLDLNPKSLIQNTSGKDQENVTPNHSINNPEKGLINEDMDEKTSLKTHDNSKKIIRKDTMKDEPQKVIVVKKIIKRDTIFVER